MGLEVIMTLSCGTYLSPLTLYPPLASFTSSCCASLIPVFLHSVWCATCHSFVWRIYSCFCSSDCECAAIRVSYNLYVICFLLDSRYHHPWLTHVSIWSLHWHCHHHCHTFSAIHSCSPDSILVVLVHLSYHLIGIFTQYYDYDVHIYVGMELGPEFST